MKNAFTRLFVLFALLVSTAVCAAQPPSILAQSPGAGAFAMGADSQIRTAILVDAGDAKVVHIAASALAGDMDLVLGFKPAVANEIRAAGSRAIIVGTLDKCEAIKQLVDQKKIDVSGIRGQWETFLITVVDKPLPGVDQALVIAGSDRRGAAFGAFELSRQMGVSPWVWWADVTPDKKDVVYIQNTPVQFGPPSVKYRGIFLNDEDFGLKPWAAKTYEPEVGDIGPKTYAKIFELLLRLKANHIWPAMHDCTKAFNYYDPNKIVADEYAIAMGSSHCEQMLRNNVDEWKKDEHGEWSFTRNRDNLLDYWDERVRINGPYENVYTLGMRAIHDNGMPDGENAGERAGILSDIIGLQRDMLRRHVSDDVTKIPQVFIPYKEVLEIYWAGLKVPDDVTLMWPDDNFGYIRRLSTPEEQQRTGGGGVYYHISYWGPPHDYLWLDTTPPALIWKEMQKAYAYNARAMWIVNVGDIKPQEIGTELFLQMAWDMGRWDVGNINTFLEAWAVREFGAAFAPDIAAIMNDYYLHNFSRKPEHMGFYDKYSIDAVNKDPEFSLIHYGDEVQQRIDAFTDMMNRARAIYDMLPQSKRDAYFELVLYPVRGAALMNLKHLYAYKSREYMRDGRAQAAYYARMAMDAFAQLEVDTAYYNKELAGGKWKLMMSDHPNDLAVFGKVKLGRTKPDDAPGLGISVEGQAKPVTCDQEMCKYNVLPQFNRFLKRTYFIDVFNTGEQDFDWNAKPSADWIVLTQKQGTLGPDTRIAVDIDYSKAPVGDDVAGTITFTGAGREFTVSVPVFNHDGQVDAYAFVQDNGVIAIDAENYFLKKDSGGAAWTAVPGLGRTGAGVVVLPATAPTWPDADTAMKQAPSMEYPIHVFKGGDAELIIHALPTHEIHAGRVLRVYVSVDGAPAAPVEFESSHQESDPVGKQNVQRNMMEGRARISIMPGSRMLTIYAADPSVVLDKIILDFGGMKKSYLGPPQTRARRTM
jgi:hypothetical protein